jgi:hypothetical protein
MTIFIIFLCIAVFYVIDVALGSAGSQYDCEVGLPSHLEEPKTLSRQEFFGYLLPLVLVGLGIPLIFTAPRWGFSALSAAAILYVGTKVWRSAFSL